MKAKKLIESKYGTTGRVTVRHPEHGTMEAEVRLELNWNSSQWIAALAFDDPNSSTWNFDIQTAVAGLKTGGGGVAKKGWCNFNEEWSVSANDLLAFFSENGIHSYWDATEVSLEDKATALNDRRHIDRYYTATDDLDFREWRGGPEWQDDPEGPALED